MKTVIFVGPTLPAERAKALLESADVRGPAQCGDVYRAAAGGATVIGLIDGYFDHCLSVWHKEILWALSRGVRVYGAASMGALRAAELDAFGMIGVGTIYSWYRDGVVESDDEVAIAHESSERGYRPVSDALVNLRATFDAARKAGALNDDGFERLVSVARSMFYPTRTLSEVMRSAGAHGMPSTELERLQRWVGAKRERAVDQKRADAEALFRRIGGTDGTPERAELARPSFTFEYTEVWHEFAQQALPARPASYAAGRLDTGTHSADNVFPNRLETAPLVVARARWEALERALALALAEVHGVKAEAAAVQQVSDDYRRTRDLLTSQQTSDWLTERGIDIVEFSEWMREEVLIARAREFVKRAVGHQLHRIMMT